MNNRDNEGRRDYRSGKGYEQGRGEHESRHARGAQYGREEQPGRSSWQESQGTSYGRSSGEYYGGHQFDERSQSAGWDEDRTWEYEGGPERYSTTGEAGQSSRYSQTGSRRGTEYGGQRERGTYGTGDYIRGQQGYRSGSQYGSGQRGEESDYARSQHDDERALRGSSRRYGTSTYGGESSGYGGRAPLQAGQEFLEEGEISGYRGRTQGMQYGAGSSRYGTSLAQHGYGTGYRSFRGVGPKNYTRSDERIMEEVNERLTDDDDLDPTEITVRVQAGKVTLEGSVDQRWMKHRAEDIADACNGVKEVDNRIQVTSMARESMQDRSSSRSTTTRTSTTASDTTPGGTTPH